jgi:hypothetical protein
MTALLLAGMLLAPPEPNPTIARAEYANAEVGEVVRGLMRIVDRPCSLDPKVRGPVTLAVENKPFREVLTAVLVQVGATYRYENGTYAVVPLRTATLAPVVRATEGTRAAPDLDRLVDVDLVDQPILPTLERLLRLADADFVIDARLRSNASCRLRNVPVRVAVARLAKLMGAEVREEGGTVLVGPPPPPPRPVPPVAVPAKPTGKKKPV